MRIIPIIPIILAAAGPAALAAGPAAAHVGHLGELAGHDHWVAGAALGGALIAGILAGLRGEREAKDEPAPDASEEGAET